jgi:hypothetical protein
MRSHVARQALVFFASGIEDRAGPTGRDATSRRLAWRYQPPEHRTAAGSLAGLQQLSWGSSNWWVHHSTGSREGNAALRGSPKIQSQSRCSSCEDAAAAVTPPVAGRVGITLKAMPPPQMNADVLRCRQSSRATDDHRPVNHLRQLRIGLRSDAKILTHIAP